MGSYTYPEKNNVSDFAKNLIECLLVKDPKFRFKIDQIFNHRFL